jgi:hypothetical protein
MTVADDPPVRDEPVQNIEWTARPKPKHRREYVRWCHGVYSCLSNRWNLRVMHVIETGPGGAGNCGLTHLGGKRQKGSRIHSDIPARPGPLSEDPE